MIIRLLVNLAVMALAFYLTTLAVPGIKVHGGIASYLLVALAFGLVNAILGSILRLLTLPLRVITLGLFSLIVNGVLLLITAAVTSSLTIDGFLTAIVAGLVLSIIAWAIHLVLYVAKGRTAGAT